MGWPVLGIVESFRELCGLRWCTLLDAGKCNRQSGATRELAGASRKSLSWILVHKGKRSVPSNQPMAAKLLIHGPRKSLSPAIVIAVGMTRPSPVGRPDKQLG